MKPVRKLSSYVLLVGVMGLSIVGGVVAYQIYSASVKTQTTPQQSIAIKPLDGVINKTTIDNLKKRTAYTNYEMASLLTVAPATESTSSAVAPIVELPPAATESTAAAMTQ